MKEKELNTAILNELYKVADEVWPLVRRRDIVGSFTAREISSPKHLGHDMFLKKEDANKLYHVEVGNFRCSFQAQHIFDFVAKFELLAGVGSKRRLFVAENRGKVEGSVTFSVTRDLEELCDFTVSDNLRPAYAFIIIDTEHKCLVATNGSIMKVCPVSIHSKKGDTSGMRIRVADFKKMCAKMKGKNVYEMTATKERKDLDIYTNIMFEGIAASAKHGFTMYKWYSVFSERSSELCFDVHNWDAIKKLVKISKGADVVVSGKRGDNTIQFSAGNCEAQVEAGRELKHSFCVMFRAEHFGIIKKAESMRFYLGDEDRRYVEAVDNNGNVYLICPSVIENITFVGEHVDGNLVAPEVACDINVLSRYILKAKRTTKSASRKASKAKKTVAEKADKPATKKQVATSRKFTFAAIGVHPGDKLTFVDGKEVVAVDDNKVAYEGSIYTLSGFCTTFMPEEKRNKSNSYRGCAFFYRDGLKLAKLFNDALEANEQPAGAVANETHEEAETAESPQADACPETKTEEHVVNVCAEENHAKKPHADVCTETKTEEQVVNVCVETDMEMQDVNAYAEEYHAEKPCIVRPVPFSVLQQINYPLRLFWWRGAAFHTRLNEKNASTFSLFPHPLRPCPILPFRPEASRPCAPHHCALRPRKPRTPAPSRPCFLRPCTRGSLTALRPHEPRAPATEGASQPCTNAPAFVKVLRTCAHVSLAALRLEHHGPAPPAPMPTPIRPSRWIFAPRARYHLLYGA